MTISILMKFALVNWGLVVGYWSLGISDWSLVFRLRSSVTRHRSPVTRHRSPVTHHPSSVFGLRSPVIRHPSPVTSPNQLLFLILWTDRINIFSTKPGKTDCMVAFNLPIPERVVINFLFFIFFMTALATLVLV